MIRVARVWPAPWFRLLAPHSHSAIYLRRNPGAGDGNRTRMTSLEGVCRLAVGPAELSGSLFPLDRG
jgi:hypothetical protein